MAYYLILLKKGDGILTNFEKITSSRQALFEFAKLYASYPYHTLVDWDKWLDSNEDWDKLPYRGTMGEFEGPDKKWVPIRIFDITFGYSIPYARIVMPGGFITTCPVSKVRTSDPIIQKRLEELGNMTEHQTNNFRQSVSKA